MQPESQSCECAPPPPPLQFKDTGCHPTFCKGSHMWPKDHRPKRPFSHPRSPEEVLPLAEDFIKQYFQSKKQ